MTTDLDASVLIGGVEYSQYLVSLERTENLAKPGAEIILEFSPDFPHGSISPWDDLVVSEQGTLTLTGFVEHIIPSREPAKVTIRGKDTYKRCTDFFTPENITTSGSQTIGYWTGFFCDMCGISYVIDSTGPDFDEIPVNDDIPFGFHSIDEILVMLAGIAQWLMLVDEFGVLHFVHIDRPSVADFTLTNAFTWEQDRNDTDTRNRALVWGMGVFPDDAIAYAESRVVDGVNGVRNMVYASPNIDTVEKAAAVAKAGLDQWARLDNVLAIDLVGDPSRHVGYSSSYAHSFLPLSPHLDTITDLKTTLSENGYNQSLTAGRRNSRFPYFPAGDSDTVPPDNFTETTMVGLMGSYIAGQAVFATLNWNDATPVWYNLGKLLSGDPLELVTDKINGKHVYVLTSEGLWRHPDVTDSDPNIAWEHMLSISDIIDLIIAVPSYGAVFTGADVWDIGGLSMYPRGERKFSFQFAMQQSTLGSYWVGLFTLSPNDLDSDNPAQRWTIGGTIWDTAVDPALPLTGSTSWSLRMAEGASSYSKNYSGPSTAKYYMRDLADLTMDIHYSVRAYHVRGGNIERVLWAPDGLISPVGYGQVYSLRGTINQDVHVTPDTGFIDPRPYPRAIAATPDDLYAIGLDNSGHLWSWTYIFPIVGQPPPINNFWVDLGLLGTQYKGIINLPDSPLHFAACGGTSFADSIDGGATWTNKSGLTLPVGADFITLDY